MKQQLDVDYHLEKGNEALHANNWDLQNLGESLLSRLKLSQRVVSFVVCFGAAHRSIYTAHLESRDVAFRKYYCRI